MLSSCVGEVLGGGSQRARRKEQGHVCMVSRATGERQESLPSIPDPRARHGRNAQPLRGALTISGEEWNGSSAGSTFVPLNNEILAAREGRERNTVSVGPEQPGRKGHFRCFGRSLAPSGCLQSLCSSKRSRKYCCGVPQKHQPSNIAKTERKG